jgi:hypothetical protein
VRDAHGRDFQCLYDLKITRWVINVLATLPFYAFGKVAVLGDAVCFFPTIRMTKMDPNECRLMP